VSQVQIRWDRRPSRPAADDVRRLLKRALQRLDRRRAAVDILVTGDEQVRNLNRRWRGIDAATDVLSFRDGEELPDGALFLGEIVISLDAARRQGEELGHGEVRELEELALHGLLHLLGRDHEHDEGEMDALELDLRAELLDER